MGEFLAQGGVQGKGGGARGEGQGEGKGEGKGQGEVWEGLLGRESFWFGVGFDEMGFVGGRVEGKVGRGFWGWEGFGFGVWESIGDACIQQQRIHLWHVYIVERGRGHGVPRFRAADELRRDIEFSSR